MVMDKQYCHSPTDMNWPCANSDVAILLFSNSVWWARSSPLLPVEEHRSPVDSKTTLYIMVDQSIGQALTKRFGLEGLNCLVTGGTFG